MVFFARVAHVYAMVPNIVAANDVLAAALLVLAALIIIALFSSRNRGRKKWRHWDRGTSGGGRPVTGDFSNRRIGGLDGKPDAAMQLNKVMAAEFWAQPLLNQSEARLFRELDRMVLRRNPGWQVMAQVSLGEILRCKDYEAYACINSKRVDLLLVDESCRPRHAIEYQGAGHYQSKAAARDAVKKEALRKAGIGYTEVVKGAMTPSELRLLVAKLVDEPADNKPKMHVTSAPKFPPASDPQIAD